MALLLRRVEYGESDVIVDLLTQRHGRIGAFARGARKSQRRFAGGLGYFTRMAVRWRPSRSDGLAQLQEAEGVEFLSAMVESPLRLAAGAWLVALVEAITQPTMGADPFFSYIWTVLRWLDEVETPEQLACGMLRAEIVLLQDAGVLASIDSCERSGESIGMLSEAVLLPGVGIVAPCALVPGEHGVTLRRDSLEVLAYVMQRRFVPTLRGEAYHPLREALMQSWAQILDRLPHAWAAWDREIRLKIP